MRPETIMKVIDIWLYSNIDKQTTLIQNFLEQLNSGDGLDWLEFLVDELDIPRESQPEYFMEKQQKTKYSIQYQPGRCHFSVIIKVTVCTFQNQ